MTDKYDGEQVLVVKREVLSKTKDCFQGIIGSDVGIWYLRRIFKEGNSFFYPRHLAEEDESLKQIIPYVVFFFEDQVFSYVRGKGGGEARLKGNRSIGIGGHVNPVDSGRTSREIYEMALKREISEEVVIGGDIPSTRAVALINDDSTPVGRVHFGIVHECHLNSRSIRGAEGDIAHTGLVHVSELKEKWDEYETWSQLCIDRLFGPG